MKTNITTFCARAAATLAFPLKRLPVALLMLFTIALMLLTTATAWAWTGSGTSDAPYQIANKSDLEDCAAYIQQDFNKTEQQYQQGRRHKPADDGSDATPVEPEA